MKCDLCEDCQREYDRLRAVRKAAEEWHRDGATWQRCGDVTEEILAGRGPK